MADIDFVEALIRSAGDLAMEYYLSVETEVKDDESYVTQADLAVQQYIRETLDQHASQDGLIAEENDLRREPQTGSRYWVIDPIDGTASFAAGLPVWGIAIGLVEAGRPIAGYFYAPVARDLFQTTAGGEVLRNGKPVRMRQPAPLHRESSLFIASRLHRYYTVHPDYPGKLRNLGSTLAHLCYVAGGNADAALVERVYVWDIAAGMAMLALNGGVLRYIDGSDVNLAPLLAGEHLPMPLLAGHPEVVTEVARYIRYNGGE
jgi:myo-inositol-1(or 4)-monophosphatase